MSSPAALVLAALVAGPLAALPPAGQTGVVVLFRPGVTNAEAFAAVRAVDGRLLWTDASGRLWAIELPEAGDALALYGHGAMLVSHSLLPAGCFNWMRV